MGEFLLFVLFVVGVYWMLRYPRKKVYYGQSFEEPPPKPGSKPTLVHSNARDDTEDGPKELTRGGRIAAIVFLSVWLSFWTVGCYFALGEAARLSYGDEGYIFIRIWLAIAIPGWFFAAWTLFRLFRGDHVEINFDGDAGGDGGGD